MYDVNWITALVVRAKTVIAVVLDILVIVVIVAHAPILTYSGLTVLVRLAFSVADVDAALM
jgi:hypothetical protein